MNTVEGPGGEDGRTLSKRQPLPNAQEQGPRYNSEEEIKRAIENQGARRRGRPKIGRQLGKNNRIRGRGENDVDVYEYGPRARKILGVLSCSAKERFPKRHKRNFSIPHILASVVKRMGVKQSGISKLINIDYLLVPSFKEKRMTHFAEKNLIGRKGGD